MKKNYLFSIVALLGLLFGGANIAAAQNNYVVVNGSDSTIHFPVETFYNYSFTEMIYPYNLMPGPGGTDLSISSIAFYFLGVNSHNQPATVNRDITVYLKNVTKQEFDNNADYIGVSTEDQYFTGTLSASDAGWVTITLDRPFAYSNRVGNHLLIAIHDESDFYSERLFACTNEDDYDMNSCLRFCADTENPDVSSLGTFDGNNYTAKTLPNLKVTFTTIDEANIPYSCDFSEASENGNWVLKNTLKGDSLASWHFADGKLVCGINNSDDYTTLSDQTVVLAERLVTLPSSDSDSLFVSFDCHVGGETLYDYLAVFLVPNDTVWEASIGLSSTDIPFLGSNDEHSHPYLLHFGGDADTNAKLSMRNEPLTAGILYPGAGNYKLVFVWRNDGNLGNGQSAQVDNVSISTTRPTPPTPPIVIEDYTPISTAQWYACAVYAPDRDWEDKIISFSMQDVETVTPATTTEFKTYAAAYAAGYMWYIPYENDQHLRKALIDPETHQMTDVEDYTFAEGYPGIIKTMSLNPVDSNLYFMTEDAIYKVSLSDPEHYTQVCSLSKTYQTLAFDALGEAYAVTYNTGVLEKINLTDGSATTVGFTGVENVY